MKSQPNSPSLPRAHTLSHRDSTTLLSPIHSRTPSPLPPCAPPPAPPPHAAAASMRAAAHVSVRAPAPASMSAAARVFVHAAASVSSPSASLSISLPLSMLESQVWHCFSHLRRPSDAYPTKSTPWHSQQTPYRIQPRHCRRPGDPTPRRLGQQVETSVETAT
jgi:hypothetical protein